MARYSRAVVGVTKPTQGSHDAPLLFRLPNLSNTCFSTKETCLYMPSLFGVSSDASISSTQKFGVGPEFSDSPPVYCCNTESCWVR